MKGLRSPNRSGNPGHATCRAAVLLLPVILACIARPAASAESQAAVWTVWKAQEVGFSYRSSIAFYSCRQLQDRVASILRALGARDDLDVKVSNCDTFSTRAADNRPPWSNTSRDPFERRSERDQRLDPGQRLEQTQMANVRIRAMMPTELTPGVAAELERDKSRRELVSRVTGDPSASRDVPVMFPAKWQSVTLSHASIGLDPEECELLEQMSSGVLRQLNVRVVRKGRACDPRRVSRIPPQLTAEALIGVPFEARTPSLPGLGEKDPDPSAPPEPAVPPK